MAHTHDSSVIDRLGGTAEVARLFGISSQAVSKWRKGIPRARRMYLQLLRPDVFEAGSKKKPARRKAA